MRRARRSGYTQLTLFQGKHWKERELRNHSFMGNGKVSDGTRSMLKYSDEVFSEALRFT